MKTTEQDTTHGNAKETNKQKSNSKLIEQEQIKGTPFTAVRYNEEWYLTLGKYRLTEPVKTKAQILKDAKRADWYRVMQIMNIMLDERIDQLKNSIKTN